MIPVWTSAGTYGALVKGQPNPHERQRDEERALWRSSVLSNVRERFLLMVRRAELQNKINEYEKVTPPVKLEALFLGAATGFKDSRANMWLRYETEDAVEEVVEDLSHWLPEFDQVTPWMVQNEGSKSRWETDDTREACQSVITEMCLRAFPKSSLGASVDRSVRSLGKEARRLAFLLLREGTVLTNALRVEQEWGGGYYSGLSLRELGLPTTYEFLFDEELTTRAAGDLIRSGLLYVVHDHRYGVPPFAANVWPRIGSLCVLPRLEIKEEA